MTKKIDFEREAIYQHKQFLESDLFKPKTIDDKRKKQRSKKLSLRELYDEFDESGSQLSDE